MTYYVYMITNRSRVVLYTGVTNSLESRLWFDANASPESFSKRYKLDRLVYYEEFDTPEDAIGREKEIKHWRRQKKDALVKTVNPRWNDLRDELFGGPIIACHPERSEGPSQSKHRSHRLLSVIN